LIVRSWNLRPRPGRYDDAVGLIAEGAKLAERHGARNVRLTQAATAGPSTGVLVLTCEFENLAGYGVYLEDTMTDVEAQTHNHRIRETEAPFIYESTAVLTEIDLGREAAKGGRGRVLGAASADHCRVAGATPWRSPGRPSTWPSAMERCAAACSSSTTPESVAECCARWWSTTL